MPNLMFNSHNDTRESMHIITSLQNSTLTRNRVLGGDKSDGKSTDRRVTVTVVSEVGVASEMGTSKSEVGVITSKALTSNV